MGAISDVTMQTENPPFIVEKIRRGRRAAGIIYENRVHEEFLKRYEGYLPSPWFSFLDDEGHIKWCQPDGLIIDPFEGKIVIVEAKYQHTADAHYQLFKIYLPVLRALFGGIYKLACCEVVKWFDCAVLCPVNPVLCPEPANAREAAFNVYIWKPRKEE